jgi:hypothetical protein
VVALQPDSVIVDLKRLVIGAGMDPHRVAGIRRVEGRLDRLARMDVMGRGVPRRDAEQRGE